MQSCYRSKIDALQRLPCNPERSLVCTEECELPMLLKAVQFLRVLYKSSSAQMKESSYLETSYETKGYLDGSFRKLSPWL